MAKQISGGAAYQPDAPIIEAGYGRNDGWFDMSFGPTIDRAVTENSSTVELVNGWLELTEVSGEIAKDQVVNVSNFSRPNWDGVGPTLQVISGPAMIDGVVLKPTGSGDVVLRATGSNGIVKDYGVYVTYITASNIVSSVKQGRAAGALATHCEDSVNTRIGGANASMLPIFTDYSASNISGSYTRNTACWAYGLDLTCISPWNSRQGKNRAGTLITPRHIINAAHYELYVGDTVRFVTDDNTVITRTVAGKKRHPDYTPYYPDLTVYTLDSDVPAGSSFCKVLPSDYADYIPDAYQVAALCLDQEEKALVTDLIELEEMARFMFPNTAEEQVLYEHKIAGDSGNPAFLLVGDVPVLLTCWTYGGAGQGTFISSLISDINQMIIDADAQAGVSTGYTLTEVDLSAFPNFTTGNYLIEQSDIENGNASLWVEDGTLNSKTAYKLRDVIGNSTLEWTGSAWEARDAQGTLIDSSSDDVATPDLATFSTLNFETP